MGMSSATPSVQVVRFGVFELDVRSGELRKRGVKLPLQGLPIQVLTILLENPGEVVTRDELRNRLWPADTFVDFDHSLHNAIARLREALGENASSPRFVETLPRRGYRFIGLMETPPTVPSITTSVTASRSRSNRALPIAVLSFLAALAFVVTLNIGGIRSRLAGKPVSAAVHIDSI